MAIGNIVGSNMFNTLAVVGLAGVIEEIPAESEIITRDMNVMLGLTLLLMIVAFPFKKTPTGIINRYEGILLLSIYIAYTGYLIYGATQGEVITPTEGLDNIVQGNGSQIPNILLSSR